MGHRDYVADLPQPSDLQDLMMRLSFKAGLFVRLLAVCILVACMWRSRHRCVS